MCSFASVSTHHDGAGRVVPRPVLTVRDHDADTEGVGVGEALGDGVPVGLPDNETEKDREGEGDGVGLVLRTGSCFFDNKKTSFLQIK